MKNKKQKTKPFLGKTYSNKEFIFFTERAIAN